MLTVQLPTLLALVGTALVAVVIFAPKAPALPVAASCSWACCASSADM